MGDYAMSDSTTNLLSLRENSPKDALTEILRIGAQQLLAQTVQAEVAEYIERHAHVRDENGRRMVVRNGHLPEREIQTGVGPVNVKQPRVNDRRIDKAGKRIRFSSTILPPYLRRTKSIEELIPWLYLKGVSTGDFTDALAAILGADAPGLSASTVTRLKSGWQQDHEEWSRRSLEGKRYVYIWADGIHFNIRLGEDERMCILVVMGATADGDKELLAVHEGYRESTMSWKEILLSLRDRGMTDAPKLAIGDGALGFWSAISEVFPETKHQRCWVHKTANILDKLPKSKQPDAKRMIHAIYMADTHAEAVKAYDRFIDVFEAKYPKACQCLQKDRESLFAFYFFPAEHWRHIRSTNPIESTFATVRLRTYRTKGCGSAAATVAMVFQLAKTAAKKWRKLNGSKLLADVIDAGIEFKDGVKLERAA